jgi:hypothetical protein
MAAAPPRQTGNERHKPHKTQVFCRKSMIMTANADKLLISVIPADRRDQDSIRR